MVLASAAAPAIATEFSISGSGIAWLTMAVQAGFVAGTLVSALLNLADGSTRGGSSPLGCVAGAAANAMIPPAGSAARSSRCAS